MKTKEERAAYNKAYYNKNKEDILTHQKELRINWTENQKEDNKKYKKEYREKNKKQIVIYYKEWKSNNKEYDKAW